MGGCGRQVCCILTRLALVQPSFPGSQVVAGLLFPPWHFLSSRFRQPGVSQGRELFRVQLRSLAKSLCPLTPGGPGSTPAWAGLGRGRAPWFFHFGTIQSHGATSWGGTGQPAPVATLDFGLGAAFGTWVAVLACHLHPGSRTPCLTPTQRPCAPPSAPSDVANPIPFLGAENGLPESISANCPRRSLVCLTVRSSLFPLRGLFKNSFWNSSGQLFIRIAQRLQSSLSSSIPGTYRFCEAAWVPLTEPDGWAASLPSCLPCGVGSNRAGATAGPGFPGGRRMDRHLSAAWDRAVEAQPLGIGEVRLLVV